MSDDHPTPPDEPGRAAEREESWACDGPSHLELTLDLGRIDITLADDATAVTARLRADPETGWSKGLSGLLHKVGEFAGPGGTIRFGGHEIPLGGEFGLGRGFDLSALADLDLEAEAVKATRIGWSAADRRLTVHSPARVPLRAVPLVLTVRAPSSSRLSLRTGMGRIVVTGRSGHADVRSGAGEVELDRVDGDLRLDTGSGAVTAHAVSGRTLTKAGSGTLALDVLDGPAVLKAGSGSIRLGAVRADVQARTGSGRVRVDDLERGRLDLDSGSGDLTIGVHPGVAAELDLRSGSGQARSELEVHDSAPDGGPVAVLVTGRTGSGDVLVTRAVVAPGSTGAGA